MIGFLIGLCCGLIQFILLSRFTESLTKNRKIPILLAFLQIFVLIITLLVCALLIPKELIWVASGIVSFLIAGAVIKFIIVRKKDQS